MTNDEKARLHRNYAAVCELKGAKRLPSYGVKLDGSIFGINSPQFQADGVSVDDYEFAVDVDLVGEYVFPLKRKYPYLGVHKTGLVVEFTGYHTGVCVVSMNGYNLGEFLTEWPEEYFDILS
jgi:hypothetical protein